MFNTMYRFLKEAKLENNNRVELDAFKNLGNY